MLENFFLFLRSLWGSWMVWAGGILRVIPFFEGSVEPWLRGKHPKVDAWFIERGAALKKNLKLIALSCLLIGCYRAWVFEHNNAQTAMYGRDGKSEAWARFNQCDKERAVKTTLADSCNTNLTYQQSRNDGQQDLFNKCLLSLGLKNKPEPLKIDAKWAWTPLKDGGKHIAVILATTNQRIAINAHITCDRQFQYLGVGFAGAQVMMVGPAGNTNDREADLQVISPAWSQSSPLAVTVFTTDEEMHSCEIRQR
jgi:hypothetical protein